MQISHVFQLLTVLSLCSSLYLKINLILAVLLSPVHFHLIDFSISIFHIPGNADELVMNSHQSSNSEKPVLTDWKMKKWLNLLNITYDVMPADLVTAVVTELAILPCTSVPVILRIKPSEI